jgi:hypothetical protein
MESLPSDMELIMLSGFPKMRRTESQQLINHMLFYYYYNAEPLLRTRPILNVSGDLFLD